MERIKKALEQAERDRATDASSATDQPAAVHDVTQRPVSPVDKQFDARMTSNVTYQKTRVIEVSPDVLEHNRLVAALPGHHLTDVYRILRTRVLQSMNSNAWKALAICSPATGSGKTLTAINLAISLAREVNRTVLLADFDLRHPSIHKYFGYEPELGLSDYLFKDAPLDSILFSPSIERLVVLPGHEAIQNSSETLRSPKLVSLVEDLKTRYPERLVIFDLPPLLAVDDALAFSPYVDAMLMVAENGATRKEDLTKALEMLGSTPVVGTVLNKSDSPVLGY